MTYRRAPLHDKWNVRKTSRSASTIVRTRPGARIYGVDETSLIWLPYQPSAETDTIPRYVLVMSMVVRPA